MVDATGGSHPIHGLVPARHLGPIDVADELCHVLFATWVVDRERMLGDVADDERVRSEL